MNIDLISYVLGWTALINYGILLLWFLFFHWHTIGFIIFMASGSPCRLSALTPFTT